jgi:hypothetical protein
MQEEISIRIKMGDRIETLGKGTHDASTHADARSNARCDGRSSRFCSSGWAVLAPILRNIPRARYHRADVSPFPHLCSHVVACVFSASVFRRPQYHKNYRKRASRLRRLRPMKIVPRHLVKRLKIMMPYWRNQLEREKQYQRITAETSVKQSSDVSFERQRAFIEAQNQRLKEQLLRPKPYFPQLNANSPTTPMRRRKQRKMMTA